MAGIRRARGSLSKVIWWSYESARTTVHFLLAEKNCKLNASNALTRWHYKNRVFRQDIARPAANPEAVR
jgi:hypothetical protein